MNDLGDRYVLGEMLGIGGMGAVYRATQRSLERTVAIKFPHPHLIGDPVVARRFSAEARAGGQLDHRNIARVIEYADRDGIMYLVMEYVPGVALDKLLAERGPFEPHAAVELFTQLLSALDAIHRAGIVHADIKSANILVETRPDGTQLVRLIDFGLARFSNESSFDGHRMLSGTPDYLAPELIESGLPQIASDIYAAGVVMYELLTGSTPFGGGTSDEILRRQVEDAVVPPSLRSPEQDIPAALEAVVLRSLEKEPAARYPTATAFAEALRIPWPPRVATPRLARGTQPSAFSTEASTRDWLREPLAQAEGAEEIRRVLEFAVAAGDSDTIIMSYLDLVRVLVDDHDLVSAVGELEQGLARLRPDMFASETPPATWRLQLCLAALYSGRGDHVRARDAASVGRDDAMRAGSTLGEIRANELLERLARNGNLRRKL